MNRASRRCAVARKSAARTDRTARGATADQSRRTIPPTADDICRAIEQDAAENELPVEFFARVIWQESRFNAQAVSPKGAQGIAQFMPQTADYRGLVDPFDPIEALKNSASYLHELREQIRQSRPRRRRLQCRSGAGQRLARRPSRAAGRDAQLRRDHHRLDRRRMGLAVAAADRGDHDPAGRAVHAARQSDPGAEGAGAAHRRLRAALGHAAHRQLVGEQGLGDLSHDRRNNTPR